jgi:intein-encoded DNA endonuclease-like protein
MPIRKTYNKDFFKTWSSDMAYILGFMYADGNITETKRGNHYIAIYTADKELLISMARCMKSNHKIAERASDTGANYRIQIGSKEWFHDLGLLGLFPDKTARMRLPKIPQKYFGDYVRGYFDGDGSIWSGLIHKDRPTKTLTIQATFTSCSLGYLQDLRLAFQSFGIKGGGIYVPKIKHYERLTFSSNDALNIYEIMYNGRHKLFLERKKVVFEQFMKLRA